VDDYLRLTEQHKDGLFVLADHSWHVMESLSGLRAPERAEVEVGKVHDILQGIMDQGVEFMTLDKYVQMEGVP